MKRWKCAHCRYYAKGFCGLHRKLVSPATGICRNGKARDEYLCPEPTTITRVRLPAAMPRVPVEAVTVTPDTPRGWHTYTNAHGVKYARIDADALKQLIHEWSSQAALARCIGTSKESVSRWLNNYRAVPLDQVQPICDALGCDPSAFVRGARKVEAMACHG